MTIKLSDEQMNVLWERVIPKVYLSMPSSNPEFERVAFFGSKKIDYKYFNLNTPTPDMVGMDFEVEDI